jgi:MFS transporter
MTVDNDPRRWRQLFLLAFAELLGMSLWFAASAVTPQLRGLWGLSSGQAAWLTTVVQFGFVCGTAVSALLNLADLIPAGALFSVSAALGALANAAILAVPGYSFALVLRFLTGFFLAGVYPPAMKMTATWFKSQRGLAIGVIVGALTVGKATPYLVRAIPHVGLRPVVLTASLGALIGAALVAAGYREGPFPFSSRPFSWLHAREVIRVREWRLATGSYLGHMFELYAFWTWIPSFLAASVAAATGGRFRAHRHRWLRLRLGWALRGQARSRAPGHDFADRERMLLPGERFSVRRTAGNFGRARDDMGLFRDCRQCAIQYAGHRISPAAHRGNGAHDPDIARLPAYHAADAGGPRDSAARRLAVGILRAHAWPAGGNRGDQATLGAESSKSWTR